MRKIDLTGAAAAALLLVSGAAARAEDLTITLTNATSATMTEFYTSPTGEESWEEDVFGDGTLGPGESVQVTIADGRDVCDYDLKFEFEEGSGLGTTTGTSNLCDTGSYTIQE